MNQAILKVSLGVLLVVLALPPAYADDLGGQLGGLPWWRNSDSMASVISTDVIMVVTEPPKETKRLRFFSYLESLIRQYGDDGLSFIVVTMDERDIDLEGIHAVHVKSVPTEFRRPVNQVWRDDELVFDSKGRPMGLDSLRQFAQKHMRDSDTSKAFGGVDRGPEWFVRVCREMEYRDASSGATIEVENIIRPNNVLLVIPSGCTTCALGKYAHQIHSLAESARSSGKSFFVLAREDTVGEILELSDDWGAVVSFSEQGGQHGELQTRYDNAVPYVCQIDPKSNTLETRLLVE